jgi:PPM family protein phosphatase
MNPTVEFHPSLVGAASDKGPVRPANEDAFITPAEHVDTRLGALYVVADGVGGQEAGRTAADLATRVVHDAFYQLRLAGHEAPAALQQAVEQANQAIYQQAQARGGIRMGCTLVAAVQFQRRLYLAHVGDARAYLARGGELHPLTRDHTWVQEQVNAGALSSEEAARHEFRNVVTRVLGNEPQIAVELGGPLPLKPGDTFLLCSDGLYDSLPRAQIGRLLTAAPPPVAANDLIQAATKAGAGDNISAIVVRVGGGKAQRFSRILMRNIVNHRIPIAILIALVGVVMFLLYLLLNQEAVPTLEYGELAAPTAAIEAPSATPTTVAILVPTSTIVPPTPSPTPMQEACIRTAAYVWLTEETSPDDLCDPAKAISWPNDWSRELFLLTGETYIRGHEGWGNCNPIPFYFIRSKENPSITGWVWVGYVRQIDQGGTCP